MLILWSRIRLLVYIRNFAKKKIKKIGDCHVIAALVVQRPDILTIPHTFNRSTFCLSERKSRIRSISETNPVFTVESEADLCPVGRISPVFVPDTPLGSSYSGPGNGEN